MKKRIAVLLLALLIAFGGVFSAPVDVEAAKVTGADIAYVEYSGIPEYSEVREVFVDPTASWVKNYHPESNPQWVTQLQRQIIGVTDSSKTEEEINEKVLKTIEEYNNNQWDLWSFNIAPRFLEMASKDTSGAIQYKITYAPGYSYDMPDFCSNLYIYGVGATFTGTMHNMNAFTSNVKIVGGNYNGSADFCGVTGLEMRDITWQHQSEGHIIEMADIKYAVFSGCTFTGNNLDSDDEDPINAQPKEALQLDVDNSSAMSHTNNTGRGCSYITISNCNFINCGRGLGSHVGKKKIFDNITVTGCKFNNMVGEAIFAQGWKNSTISNNTITNAKRCGIFAYYDSNLLIKGNTIKKISAYKGERAETYDKNKVSIMIWNCKNVLVTKNKLKAKQKKKAILTGSSKKITIKKNK